MFSLLELLVSPAMATGTNKGLLHSILHLAPPEDISEHGHLIDWLFNYTTNLNILFLVLLLVCLFGFPFLYSRRKNPKPYYTYGNKKKQIIFVTLIGVAVFLFIDLNITRISNDDYINVFMNFPDKDEDVEKVEVLAQQWMWSFRYAGQDGKFNTDDDVITINDLRVPTGKKIVFQMISKDVIHSFFLPNTRRKVDAIPGRITRMWVNVNKPGVYDIACAEMCGTYHYRMQAKMTVYDPQEYNNWLVEAQKKSSEQKEILTADMFWGWKWNY
ncbi:MAG: cytochrome c oxidase subunit II [Halobacteriovoraceae bacterium]|jgi:cytochrome c oxidase subunit II|nr:cytochrome c oxidase subunit II [Halobacteriovoraceae bacterium]MBT5094652.1 cytochrome c oxidase subunit II [Halobacteriovoraceae bacterium]